MKYRCVLVLGAILLLNGCGVAAEFSPEAEAGCTTTPDTANGVCGADYGVVRCSLPLEAPPQVPSSGITFSCISPNRERFSTIWCCKRTQ